MKGEVLNSMPNNPKSPATDTNACGHEGDNHTCDGRVDQPRVPQQSTGEEKGDLEYDGETLDEKVERPLLQAIVFALPVATALDHRPSGVVEVPVQPLLAQHCGECGQQRPKKPAYRRSEVVTILVGGPFHAGGTAGPSSDNSEICFGVFGGVRPELGLDGDGKGRDCCREQSSLRMWSAPRNDKWETHKNQGSV